MVVRASLEPAAFPPSTNKRYCYQDLHCATCLNVMFTASAARLCQTPLIDFLFLFRFFPGTSLVFASRRILCANRTFSSGFAQNNATRRRISSSAPFAAMIRSVDAFGRARRPRPPWRPTYRIARQLFQRARVGCGRYPSAFASKSACVSAHDGQFSGFVEDAAYSRRRRTGACPDA